MNRRLIAGLVFVAGLIAAIGYDLRLRRAAYRIEASGVELARRTAEVERSATALPQEIAAARSKLETVKARAAKQAPRIATVPAAVARKYSPPPAADSPTRISSAVIGDDADLRALSVRAYVGERRLLFAGLLHELGLTEPQLQRFDAIQAEYRHGLLDLAASMATQGIKDATALAPLQKQLTETRDTQLREIFGDSFGAWEEASRTQGARVMVGQLLQQTFQTAGPVENAQIERLVTTAAMHVRRGAGSGYDWDAIATDAGGILDPAHLEAFKSAIAYRRLTDQMNVLSAPKR
jgi:hypothetical protein